MTSITCAAVQARLAAFVDGELRGHDVLSVGQHLESCDGCATEAKALRDIGIELRAAAAQQPTPPAALAGLADGVISRTRAERQQSWSALFARGVEDCHWALTVGGAIASTVVVACFVFAICNSGAKHQRTDSLAGVIQAEVRANADAEAAMLPAVKAPDDNSRADVVSAINLISGDDSTTFVTSDGRIEHLDIEPQASRKDVETLVGEMSRMAPQTAGWLLTKVRVKVL